MNAVVVQNSEVILDKFQEVRIYTSRKYREKYITKSHNCI